MRHSWRKWGQRAPLPGTACSGTLRCYRWARAASWDEESGELHIHLNAATVCSLRNCQKVPLMLASYQEETYSICWCAFFVSRSM
jgi:hypothetical protein